MTTDLNQELPSALDCRRIAVEREGKKAADFMRGRKAAEEEKKAMLDRLEKPSGVSDEERMQRTAYLIKRAVDNGLAEVEVGRFSNRLCVDYGRAINQQEPGWEQSLIGLPKELYQFWKKYLQPKGYRIKYQVADWPNGMPGDISVTLSWG